MLLDAISQLDGVAPVDQGVGSESEKVVGCYLFLYLEVREVVASGLVPLVEVWLRLGVDRALYVDLHL